MVGWGLIQQWVPDGRNNVLEDGRLSFHTDGTSHCLEVVVVVCVVVVLVVCQRHRYRLPQTPL